MKKAPVKNSSMSELIKRSWDAAPKLIDISEGGTFLLQSKSGDNLIIKVDQAKSTRLY